MTRQRHTRARVQVAADLVADATFDTPPAVVASRPLAAAEWARLVPILRARQQITEGDRGALIALCLAWARYLEAIEKAEPRIVKVGNRAVPNPWLTIETRALAECTTLWAELGLTPASREAPPAPPPPPPEALTVTDDRVDAEALADRRRRVVSLRLLKKTERAIAAAVGVSEATVSRDLRWIRSHWRAMFGTTPRLHPGEAIGETLALYAEVELQALEDAVALGSSARADDPVAKAHARMRCLETVIAAREAQVEVLARFGVLDRATVPGAVRLLPTANALRERLAAIIPAELVEPPPPAPRA